jgi:uncharacterized protein DUF3631
MLAITTPEGAATKLAQKLRRFGIKARVIKLADGSTPRGFLRADFEDSWARYCSQKPGKDATLFIPLKKDATIQPYAYTPSYQALVDCIVASFPEGYESKSPKGSKVAGTFDCNKQQHNT